MRPRVFPAEDADRAGRTEGGDRCFNEAAGIPRGRHPQPDQHSTYVVTEASMRPRVFPAEDLPDRQRPRRPVGLASMRPRVFPAEDFWLSAIL